ncbi:hypothetical protein [Nonomuraea sp. NPDC003804]|uniref:hypothetical protein n=1 Tax=Nonomuraea sp. NPDC003804 TaxID=3154547 RepID=UPI0033BCC2BB
MIEELAAFFLGGAVVFSVLIAPWIAFHTSRRRRHLERIAGLELEKEREITRRRELEMEHEHRERALTERLFGHAMEDQEKKLRSLDNDA